MLKQPPFHDNGDTALKRHLIECYGGFASKTIRDPRKGNRFIVDDREKGGMVSHGELYGSSCGVILDVESDALVRVLLISNVPDTPEVRETYAAFSATDGFQEVQFNIGPAQLPLLRTLAKQIRDIVAPGKRYSVASYVHMCPRTAGSLDRLADNLGAFWNG